MPLLDDDLVGDTAQTGGDTARLLSGDKGGVLLIISLRSIFISQSFSEEMVNRLLSVAYRGENGLNEGSTQRSSTHGVWAGYSLFGNPAIRFQDP